MACTHEIEHLRDSTHTGASRLGSGREYVIEHDGSVPLARGARAGLQSGVGGREEPNLLACSLLS
jgi:hypothetical protein